jgi:hypothetical protein
MLGRRDTAMLICRAENSRFTHRPVPARQLSVTDPVASP